jgi:hypothetical protein
VSCRPLGKRSKPFPLFLFALKVRRLIVLDASISFIVVQPSVPPIRRSLSCELASPLPPEVRFLMQDFRLMVNRSVHFALENDLTAKGSLVKFAQSMAKEYHINFQHARIANEVALSLVKGHRRRLRKGEDGVKSRTSSKRSYVPTIRPSTFPRRMATFVFQYELANGQVSI